MAIPLPVECNPELKSERLALVAQWLLEELYATEDDLARETDSAYTRGCTAFGRQMNRIKFKALSGEYEWLALLNGGNDIVFTIGGVPCRFSNDDPSNPTKDAVVATSRYQMPFLEFVTDGQPGKFCFVIDRGSYNLEDPRVEFLGFSPSGEIACRWVSDSVRVLRDVVADPAPPVELGKPVVAPKKKDGDASIEAEA
jgi:hypothetical protein